MKTITSSIEAVVQRSQWLAEALGEGIINLSALARSLRPELEREHIRPFTEGAIVMALKRIQKSLPAKRSRVSVASVVQSLNIRSNIVQYAFQNSPSLLRVQEKLFQHSQDDPDSCIFFARGTYDTGIIVHENMEGFLRKITAHERLIHSYHDLSYVSIRFRKDITDMPGVYYPFFQTLAWHNMNIVQIIAGYAELGFIFEAQEIDRAFAILKPLTEQGRASSALPKHHTKIEERRQRSIV